MADEKEVEKYAGYPKVRPLTRKDRKKLSSLIKDFADRSGNSKLTSMLPGAKKKAPEVEGDESEEAKAEAENDNAYDLIKSVMEGLLEWVEDDLTKWFMEIIDVSDQDAYDALPFDIETYIVESLIAQKAFNNFFTRASVLYKKIRG